MKTNNISLRFGLFTGLISAVAVQVLFLTFDLFNVNYSWGFPLSSIRGFIGLFSLVILGTGIYWGMQKSKAIDGEITWGQAAIAGIIISLVASLIATVGAVLFNYLNPGFPERMVNESIALLVKGGKNPDQIRLAVEKIKQESSFFMTVIQAFTGQLFGGTIISVVMATFVKNKLRK